MWAFVAGGALLAVGIILIAFALLRPDGKDDSAKTINLTSAPAPTTDSAPTTTTAPTQNSTPTRTAESKKPRATVTRTRTESPKAETTKPKAKSKGKAKKPGPIRPVANGDYVLRNVITGKCVAPLKLAELVTQTDCGNAGNLNLESTRSENGVKLYRLRASAGASACLDVPEGGSQPSATDISAFDCSNPSTNDNQEWQLKNTGKVSRGHAVFTVVNFKSGNCLDVANSAADKADRASGLKLTIFTCAGAAEKFDDHLWTFN
jgi:hypothetical protein